MGSPALPLCRVTLTAPRPLPPGYPTELRTIGDHIRRKRAETGMLQKELAARLGVDKTTVGKWERGLTTPAIRHGPGIIRFLGYVPLNAADSLSEQLKAYRWTHGVTQRRLAQAVGVDELAIRTWESGRTRPNRRNRRRLKNLLSDPIS